MTNSLILAKFANLEDGVESVVAKNVNGYAVSIRDTDADEVVPLIVIYPTLEAAIASAKSII